MVNEAVVGPEQKAFYVNVGGLDRLRERIKNDIRREEERCWAIDYAIGGVEGLVACKDHRDKAKVFLDFSRHMIVELFTKVFDDVYKTNQFRAAIYLGVDDKMLFLIGVSPPGYPDHTGRALSRKNSFAGWVCNKVDDNLVNYREQGSDTPYDLQEGNDERAIAAIRMVSAASDSSKALPLVLCVSPADDNKEGLPEDAFFNDMILLVGRLLGNSRIDVGVTYEELKAYIGVEVGEEEREAVRTIANGC